ncbi:MAG: hypothetical protein KBC17_03355 [Candidatus Pacebacteria bacterium]|nr:hypothetical protein [Candidatus Paceibacterota bacterium]
MNQKIKNILPSKKFTFLIILVIAVVLSILIGSSYFGSKKNFQSNKNMSAVADNGNTIGDVIRRDSNGNGIPDWEETLWGFDPKGNGSANKKAIEEKKLIAVPNGALAEAQSSLTENEKFSQDLLTTVVALQTSGSLTPEVLSTLGQSLEIDLDSRKTPKNVYTKDDISVYTKDTRVEYQTYRAQFKRLVLRYENSGMQNEFDIISVGLDENAPADSMEELLPIAEAYINFGKEIIALDTPVDAVPTALALANVSDHVGKSLIKLSKLYTDSMAGVVGLDEYINDIDPFNQASEDVISYFASRDLEL